VETFMVVDRREMLARRIERELDRAYRLARAIMLDDREAEDAVQDACLIAWQKNNSLRDADLFSPWFERVVINVCRDRLRRRQRQRVRALALKAAATGDRTAPGPVDDNLDEALAALDADHRAVVVLRYWRDLTAEEIADRLGLPVGTVKSRLHYSLKKMRATLEATDGRA
jgi:RNA polymerase sigma-70 factor (ECF subfamily)